MSGFRIVDGTGTCVQAQVDSDNRLQVKSVALAEPAARSQAGQFYVYFSPIIAVDTTSQQVFYFSLGGEKNFHITEIYVGYNGGSTTGNKTLLYTSTFGDGLPTTNIAATAFLNTNLTSTNSVPGTILAWDGVGSGMTGGTAGLPSSRIYVSKGFTQFPFPAELIITPGTSIGVLLQAEEAGNAAFGLSGYTLDSGE